MYNDSENLAAPPSVGLRFATLFFSIMFPMAAATGCLVTEDTEFPTEEPVPSVLLDYPSSTIKFGDIVVVSDRQQPVTWSVRVRDPNVGETLIYRIYRLSGTRQPPWEAQSGCDEQSGGSGDTDVLEPTGTVERVVPMQFELFEDEGAACYKLMLAVASSFDVECWRLSEQTTYNTFYNFFSRTLPRNQAAVAQWWFVTTDTPDSAPNFSGCSSFFTEQGVVDAP